MDVSDAFPDLAIHENELEHCLTPGAEPDTFVLFKCLLLGYKTAPLLWSRVAAWLGRFLQACVPAYEGQRQIYLDDSFWVVQGTLPRRNLIISFIVYTMAALGVEVAVRKGERGGDRIPPGGRGGSVDHTPPTLPRGPDFEIGGLERK